MAGIIHEVERTDLLEQVRQEAANAAAPLFKALVTESVKKFGAALKA